MTGGAVPCGTYGCMLSAEHDGYCWVDVFIIEVEPADPDDHLTAERGAA